MSKSIKKRILGIDPGTNILGYSLIETDKKDIRIDSVGIIRLDKVLDHHEKLKTIFEKINHLIEEYAPTEMAIETPFYGKNAQSMLKLGRAQGVAIASAAVNCVEVFEYAPRKIKQCVTGNGNASKEQVSAMLQTICKLERMPSYFDATDALGVAVCHFFQSGKGSIYSAGSQGASWSTFIKENPERLK